MVGETTGGGAWVDLAFVFRSYLMSYLKARMWGTSDAPPLPKDA